MHTDETLLALAAAYLMGAAVAYAYAHWLILYACLFGVHLFVLCWLGTRNPTPRR